MLLYLWAAGNNDLTRRGSPKRSTIPSAVAIPASHSANSTLDWHYVFIH